MIVVATIITASPVRAQDLERWQPHIEEASSRFGVPSAWIRKVIWAESRGRTQIGDAPIRSPKGAIGLMQLMPRTWADMRARLSLGNDPDNPRDNIFAGTFYLRLLYDRFGYPGLLAAYNAGPARYEKYLAGIPLPAETVAYLAGIAGSETSVLPQAPPLFVGTTRAAQGPVENPEDKSGQTRGEVVDRGGETPIRPPTRDPLFAVRNDAH